MVRIADKKLIIEIPCHSQSPLALLSDLQNGLIDVLHAMPYSDAPKEAVSNGQMNLTHLLKEMMISQDQASHVNESLSTKQITEFNNW